MRQIIKCFSLDLTATQTAKLCCVSRNSINLLYSKFRMRIFEYGKPKSPFQGEFEADESYFGPERIKGKRGRGAGSKIIVFGLLKCGDKVYTEIVPDVKSRALSEIIRGRADIESIIHTGGWGGYDGLVDLGFEKHRACVPPTF